MRDFFERQDVARKNSRWLILVFAIAVICIILSVYIPFLALYLWWILEETVSTSRSLWQPDLFFGVTIVTLVIVVGGTLLKISAIREGGYRVAEMMGGQLVPSATNELKEKKLINVVQEMALASGMPVPSIYVMYNERGINAFAAGFDLNDMVVCVTKGALDHLSRDELQGVIGHEFSHILNSDTSINLHLIGWLHGILVIGMVGEQILRGLRHTRRNAHVVLLLGVSLYIVGYAGAFFGKMIKSAVSRQREFLADAASVQYTRNPDGLAGALKKIGGVLSGSRIQADKANEISHMYFVDGLQSQYFATHPPLEERILRLDQAFDGKFTDIEKSITEINPKIVKQQYKPEPFEAMSGGLSSILTTIGAPLAQHVEITNLMLDKIPAQIKAATSSSFSACALTYVLLLARDKGTRSKQMEILQGKESSELVSEILTLAQQYPDVSPQARLPLMELSMPALREMSKEQYLIFKSIVNLMIRVDSQYSTFELLLQYSLFRHLEPRFLGKRKRITQIYGLRGVISEASYILSLMARFGHVNEGDVINAFDNAKALITEPGCEPLLVPIADCMPDLMDNALDKLASASPLIKKRVLAACLDCLTFDKDVKHREVEFFRAVADALECPVPPWANMMSEIESTDSATALLN